MAKPFWHGEPWVFDASLAPIRGYRPKDGDFVELRDDQGRKVGAGFFNSRSSIRLRLLTFGEDGRNLQEVLGERIKDALSLRQVALDHLGEGTTAWRLIHAEGDGIPGLIVDRFGDFLVMQIDCLGLERFESWLVEELMRLNGARGIYRRVSRVAREEEGSEKENGVVAGEAPPEILEILEHGIAYEVSVHAGQKTGFYTDQRDNRLLLSRFCRKARFLDAFSYTGSFGFTALRHGAADCVTAIDSSAPALEVLERQGLRNSLGPIETIRGNVLRVLDHFRRDGRRFDVVSLDPPKLVPKKAALRRGLRLYQEINEKGLAVLEPGGFLATCSCSGAVSADDFERMVAQAASNQGRRIQLLARGSQGVDHPERVPHRASRYLKFRLYRVI